MKGRAVRVTNGKSVVSITPLPLDRDSRTMKQAMSLSQAGYQSIVVANGVVVGDPSASLNPHAARAPSNVRRFEQLRRSELPTVLQIPIFAAWLANYSWRFILRPLLSIPRADLYILHECSTLPAVQIKSTLANAPFIFDAHDLYSELTTPEHQFPFDQRFIIPFIKWLERAAFSHGAQVMTVSNGLADEFESRYARRPIVIRNAHDSRLDQPGHQTLRDYFRLPRDIFVIVTVGNRKVEQDLMLPIRVLDKLSDDIHWIFVGAGYETMAGLAKQAGVGARLHIAGRLAPTEIVPSIRGANLAVLLRSNVSPNNRFALPNAFFQAAAAGLPQLAPNIPEVARLIRSMGLGGILEHMDEDTLASEISKFKNDSEQRSSCCKNVESLRSDFEWQAEEERFLDVINSVLGR